MGIQLQKKKRYSESSSESVSFNIIITAMCCYDALESCFLIAFCSGVLHLATEQLFYPLFPLVYIISVYIVQ